MASTSYQYPVREIPNLFYHDDYDDHDNHDNHTGGRACVRAGARACAREGDELRKQLRTVAEAWEDTFSRHMPRAILVEIMEFHRQGAGFDLVAEIIRYTAGAPRPSWAYARAVLRRQMAAGVQSAKGFLAAENARAGRQWSHGKRVIEQAYEQREYNPADFDELSDEQLEELAKREAAR